MSFLASIKSLFSSSESTTTAPEVAEQSIEYKDFTITPTPIKEGGQYRLSSLITKGSDDLMQSHTFIRSDVVASRDDCIEMTIRKAKIAIDQMGDNLFN
ncbi:HlyU family transcriptional regulator [Psychromonas aquatilis]|uniref:HlyU family transcriptional regulator n=1 Tax=Psychromonas aquatilis TaxID=2005072 RepID=A0ABU9GQ48_9GAMM